MRTAALASILTLSSAGCLSGPNRADGDGGPVDDGGVSDDGGTADAGVPTLSPLLNVGDGNQITVFNDRYSVTLGGVNIDEGYAIRGVQIPSVGPDELILSDTLAPAAFLEYFGGVLLFDANASHEADSAPISFERGNDVTVQMTVLWSVGAITSGVSRYSFYPDGRVIRADYVDATVAEGQWLLAYLALNPQHFANVTGSSGMSFDHADAVAMGPGPTMIAQTDRTWVCASTPNSYRVGWASRFTDDTTAGPNGARATFNLSSGGAQVATAALQTDWVRSRLQATSPDFSLRAVEILMDFGRAGSDATCAEFAPVAQEFLNPATMTVVQGTDAGYNSERDLYNIVADGSSTVEFTLDGAVSRLSLAVFDMPGMNYTVTLDGRTLVEGVDYLVAYEYDPANMFDNAWLFVATPIAANEALVMTATP